MDKIVTTTQQIQYLTKHGYPARYLWFAAGEIAPDAIKDKELRMTIYRRN